MARVAKAALVKGPGGVGDANHPVEIAPGVANKAKVRQPGRRGPQKLPTKVAVTVRYSPEVLDYFKATGDGWQTRMNDVLRRHVEEQLHDQQHRAA
ncbi:BrnA antitoxin family protein [Candidatus Accumulibacter sp. ACC005]|uniref:BrnA antitoxin family protein n=1 Tax=Candidatus Accumulibacter sp. ACC005 TaxID=2823331 RepID=UPI0025C5C9B0|nr:BrnA antitoxin family protein [Candidatus Accumulibacter sp. ACC005]